MRNPASRGDLLELRDVAQRVEVIGLAQPLLAHVDEPERSSCRASALIQRSPTAIGAFFRTCV